jgi:hypothetical protein
MPLEIITNKLEIPQVQPNQFPDLVEFMKNHHNDLPISLYDEYYQLATELGYPALKNYYNIQTFNKNGRLDDETSRTMSRSMLRNQWNCMLMQMSACYMVLQLTFGSGYLSYKNTSGSTQSTVIERPILIGNTIAQAAYGLIVGRGNTAVTFNDYKLQTACSEGTGANQLNYAAGLALTKTWSAVNKEFTIQYIRYANNNSAGNIDLVESGVVANWGQGYLIIRDVFATKTVNIGGQVKITYDFVSNTFPE